MEDDLVKAVNILVFTVALSVSAGLAQADSVSYCLDKNNSALPETSYLQVTISDNANGNDIDFQVDVLLDAFSSPDFTLSSNFGMQSFYFNYDKMLTVAKQNIVNIDPSSWNILTDRTADGYGLFQFDLKGNGHNRTETLFFTIANVQGDDIHSYAVGSSGSAANSGEYFAAHVAGFDYQGSGFDFNGNTYGRHGASSAFFAGSTPVPVPAAAWLLSPALLGLMGFRRRS